MKDYRFLKHIKYHYDNPETPVKALFFNVITSGGIAAAILSNIISAMISFQWWSFITILLITIILIIIFYLSNHTGNYDTGSIMINVVITMVLFPVLYFPSGGINSGMSHWIVLGLLFTFLLLEGKTFWTMLILELIEYSIVYYVDYRFPELEVPISTLAGRYLDVMQSSFLVAAVIGLIFRVEKRVYERAKNEADTASRAKSDFLANISHEIRTPINAVLGMNEMILRESREKQIIEYAQTIENAGKNLLSLVNDILDFSKIESGKMQLIEEEYDVEKLLNDVIHMVRMRAQEKKLDFKVEVDPAIPEIMVGDAGRLSQIIMNLLTNAIKYTDEGGVMMSVSAPRTIDGYFLEIHVIDTGKGIKKEDQEVLFDTFQRLDEKKNRSVEGTGLGLSLVKKYVTMMNGTVNVNSAYGEGSDFSILVPQMVKNYIPLGRFDLLDEKRYQNRRKYHRKFTAPEAKILVVDDNTMNISVFRNLVKEIGVQVDSVISGRGALEKVKKDRYDMIFLDHLMPEMDGIETLQAMKTMPDNQNKDVPVIVLTANAIVGARDKYLKAGFNDYLSKPVDAETLEKMIGTYLPEELVIKETGKQEDVETTEPLEEAYIHIPGITYNDALEYSADGRKGVVENLRIYLDNHETMMKNLEDALREKNYRRFTVHVHSLKSTSLLIGASEISAMAAELERAGQNSDAELIEKKSGEFLSDYEILCEHIEIFLESEAESGEDQAEYVELQPATRAEIFSVLDAMDAGAEDYDDDIIREQLEHLEQMDYLSECKKELKKALDQYDYEKVREITDRMREWK